MKRRPRHKHAKAAPRRRLLVPVPGPVYLFDRASVREVDRLAVEQYGVPSLVLMENAARHAADVALEWMEDVDSPHVLIVCGRGNNGGDGLAIARHLSNAGLSVIVALLGAGERFEGDAGTQLRIVRAMGVPIHELAAGDPAAAILDAAAAVGGVHLVVDALVGTGLDRAVAGPLAATIGGINQLRGSGAKVLAVDVPSGMDSDSGQPLGAAVIADVTVTFVGLKRGFLAVEARKYLGEIVVADIGAPRALVERLGKRLPPMDGGIRGRAPGSRRRRRP